MDFLIIRLQGLLMSFGEGDHWDVRGTNRFPGKSIMVGIIAAGLGLDRSNTQKIAAISQGISFAVREDNQPGFLRDYHTILDTRKADGKLNDNAVVSPRHYLTDANYTVLAGIKNRELKNDLLQALTDPKWPPFLGRKSCIPSVPIFQDEQITAENDHQAFLKIQPLIAVSENHVFSCMGEANQGRMGFVKDEVISYEPRIYKDRRVYYYTIHNPEIQKGA